MELPKDLLIFSPLMVTHALCSHHWAKPHPAARDWACSFSWWGKRRSIPPAWMSKVSPRYLRAMAEHSKCQPGRPRPYGVGQEAVAGSEALAAFHKAKSCGLRLSEASSSTVVRFSNCWRVSSPYWGKERTSKYTLPSSPVYA